MLRFDMNKFLGIIVMGLLFCNIGNSETTAFSLKEELLLLLNTTSLSEIRAKEDLIIKSLKKEEITNEFLKGKSSTDLINLGFSKNIITTTSDFVQYHLYGNFVYDPYLDESLPKEVFSKGYLAPKSDIVIVICFIQIKLTECRLP